MDEFVCANCGNTIVTPIYHFDNETWCLKCAAVRMYGTPEQQRKAREAKRNLSILCVKHVVTTMADASETDAWLIKTVTMPAPPAPMSYVTDGAWECQAHEVAWFSNLGQYVAFDSPDTELRDAHMNQKHHHRSVEEIVSDWVEGGWEYLGRGATLMDAMLDAARKKNVQERDDTADPETVRNAREIDADGS